MTFTRSRPAMTTTIMHIDGLVVHIKRSSRRQTLAITIRHGQIALLMPTACPLTLARRFIRKKRAWIKDKLSSMPRATPCQFKPGETLLFLGRPCQLKFIDTQPPITIHKHHQTFLIYGQPHHMTPQAVRTAFIVWFKHRADLFLLPRIQRFATQTGLTPRSVTLKTYRARWGSCRANGDIQLNWKLMMAPKHVIDYVLIHELCHLEHFNHAPAFWQLVARHAPQFETARHWLNTHGVSVLDF